MAAGAADVSQQRARRLAQDDRTDAHLRESAWTASGLRQLTDHHYWSDLDPTYLPNGDVAFVSERCGYSLQCNHDPRLDETSCNLYVMHADGSGIRRLSVNKDGDYLPHCLDDGTIGYTRWEYHERNLTQIQSLVVRAARRHLGRCAVQAAPERSLGDGGCPFDSRRAAAKMRGDCRRPSHAGRRARWWS